MLTPKDYIGPLMELAQDRRGEFKEMRYITENRAAITYELPLAEVDHLCVLPSFMICAIDFTTNLVMYDINLFSVDGRGFL